MAEPIGISSRLAEALDYHLSILRVEPRIPVSWPGVKFSIPNGPWFRASFVPGPPLQATYGETGLNRHGGQYVVSLFWLIGSSDGDAREVADALAAHFERGTTIDRNGLLILIDTPPFVQTPLFETDWIQIPVVISWYCYAANT